MRRIQAQLSRPVRQGPDQGTRRIFEFQEVFVSMFCYQCQEAAKGTGCTVKGICGKVESTSNLQDLLIYVLKGIALWAQKAREYKVLPDETGVFIAKSLFATITNGNFDDDDFVVRIRKALKHRESLRQAVTASVAKKEIEPLLQSDAATWEADDVASMQAKALLVGVLSTDDDDHRSLSELLIYGIKGMAAYADHAAVLGYQDPVLWDFFIDGLASTEQDLSTDERISMVLKAGEMAVRTMALLDKANTETYGDPEISTVNLGVRKNPGILVSGHDLRDLQELLEQTHGTGVDVYTHSEMLPAHYYPAFKKYDHFVGNYGNSWWKQNKEFEAFNGPILMTTNCIVPVKESYKDRIYTTGETGYPGVTYIADRKDNGQKDFSVLIEHARNCAPPTELETGSLVGGFAHHQVTALADKVVQAVKSGAIRRFVVMAGCDGRSPKRNYFTEVAETLPKDTVILTAGCAKYRYNKLGLGDIDGIPRVLDAGQCNDSYSLAIIALKLKEAFELEDINDLPLSFDIAWYEQKAVTVLLGLLHLGVKGLRLGPTLPAFLSPNVAKVLVEKFNIKPTGEVQADVDAMMAGN